MVRLGGRGWSDAYGRRRRAARRLALVLAAAALGAGPAAAPRAPAHETTVAAASRAEAPAPPAPYWPVAWLDGTPTRPNGFPLIEPIDAGEVAIAPPPASFDAPAEPPAPPPAALTATQAPQQGRGVWAVVVGIDDYPGRGSDLRSAKADARDVDAALARYGVPAGQRLLLLDRQANAATLRSALDWLAAHAGPDATAVLFYAGHVRELSRSTEAIVAADGGLVTDADVAARLASLRASRTWLAFASCYGGGFDEALAPGRVLTAAAGGDSLAYESTAYGRSYLVEYMVRRAMLQGHADDSVEQAFAWAAAALRRDHPKRVPVQTDRADGDVQLGTPGAATTGSATPPPQQPPPPRQPSPTTTEPERTCSVQVGTLVRCPDDRAV